MKKILALILVCSLALCLLAGCAGGKPAADASGDASADAATSESGNKVVKIGVYEPQTGDNGAGGKQEILGMQYANYVQPTVEIGGETYDVKLEIVDNRTTAENGPSAAAELVNRDVSIVLGSYGSGAPTRRSQRNATSTSASASSIRSRARSLPTTRGTPA